MRRDPASIKHMPTTLGKSYRHIWWRVKEAEPILQTRLVETQVGGKDAQRSELTAEARRLVERFLRARKRLLKLLANEFGRELQFRHPR